MYHEFGHDVYRYEHSTDPDDIMYPSVSQSDVRMNDFILAKNRFLMIIFGLDLFSLGMEMVGNCFLFWGG